MSYEDIKGFAEKIKELETAYKYQEKIDETLGNIIMLYTKLSSEGEAPSLINLLKEKIVMVVMANEGAEKVNSLEASLH